MTWHVEYTKNAQKDFDQLDGSQRLLVLKAVEKIRTNPLPHTEGGYGKLLGNHSKSKLAGLLKIKLKQSGLRIVYQIIRNKTLMQIIIISVRDNDTVYRMAEQRLHNP